MLNSPVFFKKILLMGFGVVLMTTLVTTAKAADRSTVSHAFDLDGITDVEISNAVGRIEVVPASGREMRVVVTLEGKRKGLLRRSVDVSGMDLEIHQRADTLMLSFGEDDVAAEWVVELPRVERTLIHMGIGEMRLQVGATDLDVELGVGDITVEAPVASVGRVNLNVGVGDINVRGGQVIAQDAAFIAQRVRASGEGSNPLEIDLGVGELSLRMN